MTPGADNFSLGHPGTHPLPLNTPDEVNAVIREIFSQAKRCLHIRAGRLEPAFFGSEQLSLSITTLLTDNPHNRVCFLIDDAIHFIHSQPRLIKLARTFSSYVKVHQLPEDHRRDECFYIIADKTAYLYQSSDNAYPARAEACAPAEARKLEHRFQQCWDRSACVSGLFTTGL